MTIKQRRNIVYMQLDAMDCGPSCLRMVARFYGKRFSLQHLRGLSHITREGVSMLGISDAAEAIGFRTQGVKLTWKQLCDEVSLPCIVHWRQNHFVVVYDIRKRGEARWFRRLVRQNGYDHDNEQEYGEKHDERQDDEKRHARNSNKKGNTLHGRGGEDTVYVADPAHGLVSYTGSEFLKYWLSSEEDNHSIGMALLLEPTPEFYRDDDDNERKFKISHLFGHLKQYKRFIVQIFLALLVGSLISLIFPFITQSVVDFGINNNGSR